MCSLLHLPLLCEDKNVQYVYVPSKIVSMRYPYQQMDASLTTAGTREKLWSQSTGHCRVNHDERSVRPHATDTRDEGQSRKTHDMNESKT